MKIAVILDADAPGFYAEASHINAFLQGSGLTDQCVELWLFSHLAPQRIPQLACAVAQVRWADAPRLAEARLALLAELQRTEAPQTLLFAGDEGSELATRLACRIGGSACCAVERAQIEGDACRVEKPVYGNNLQAMLTMAHGPWCLSAARGGSGAAQVVAISCPVAQVMGQWQTQDEWLWQTETLAPVAQPLLHQARYVLAVGEGAGSAQNVAHLRQLAASIGAELAASRPVVMNAWCEMERLLGMSGAMIAPEVCIVAGASGAPAFAVGIRHSRLIVAINQDPQAAIFAQADVGIVGDMHQVLPALASALQPKRNSMP